MRVLEKIFIAACFLSIMSICSVGQAHVLDGAKEWNGHYYKVFEMPMKWDNADAFCKSVGGHLATAETQDENEMLKQLFLSKEGSSACWIGGKRDKQKVWRWISGKVIADYFDWANGQPRSDGNAGGSSLCLRRSQKGKWDNPWSSDEYPFICEWESVANAHESNM